MELEVSALEDEVSTLEAEIGDTSSAPQGTVIYVSIMALGLMFIL